MKLKKIRGYAIYEKWRKDVLIRDKWVCRACSGRGWEAHHKKPMSSFPELAFEVKNGLCFCSACHCKAHSKKGVMVGKRWLSDLKYPKKDTTKLDFFIVEGKLEVYERGING